MTVLIHDANDEMAASGIGLSSCFHVHELLYADDTLLIEAREEIVQQYMQCVADAGKVYGLSLNWTKVEMLAAGCDPLLHSPDGQNVARKDKIVYLGSVLSADGSSGSEMNRRVGSARAELEKLSRVWKHAGISVHKKLEIFEACVMSKLFYNLHALSLNTAEKRKLNAFHVKGLRKILRIPHSYYSRVSNQQVLTRAGARQATDVLLERQLLWLGRLALKPDGDALRQSVLKSGPRRLEPRSPEGKRRRGRPRLNWATQVHRQALLVANGQDNLDSLWQDDLAASAEWVRLVKQHCRN